MGKQRNEQETYAREVGLDQKIEYTGNNAIYIGRANPGALTSEAKWQIYKLAYDGSGNMTTMRWADKTDDFIKIWDNRATYNYTDI